MRKITRVIAVGATSPGAGSTMRAVTLAQMAADSGLQATLIGPQADAALCAWHEAAPATAVRFPGWPSGRRPPRLPTRPDGPASGATS